MAVNPNRSRHTGFVRFVPQRRTSRSGYKAQPTPKLAILAILR